MRAASRTTAGTWQVGAGTLVVAGLLMLVVPIMAAAHGTEAHAADAHGAPTTPSTGAVTGGGAAPGAIPTVNEPVTGGGAPANGAQPTAPGAAAGAGAGALPPVVNTGVAPVKAAVATTAPTKTDPKPSGSTDTSGSGSATTTTTTTVTDLIADPVTSVPTTASGGGGVTGGGDVEDAGANVVPTAAPTVAGAGDLPFTGIDETILLISLAGMLVPIGVLLYCGARRGEHRWLRAHLAGPRFEWRDAPRDHHAA